MDYYDNAKFDDSKTVDQWMRDGHAFDGDLNQCISAKVAGSDVAFSLVATRAFVSPSFTAPIIILFAEKGINAAALKPFWRRRKF